MTETQKVAESTPVPPARPAAEDLSRAIEKAVARQSDEQVHCVRVFEDRYRCNWWVRTTTEDWLSFTTGSIRKSTFLRATKQEDKLVIEDLSKPR